MSTDTRNNGGPAAEAAIRTLEAKGYTFHGGEYWKPPLGEDATPLLDRIDQLSEALDAAMKLAFRQSGQIVKLVAEREAFRETLGLFRDFVLNNAKAWVVGSNHHHPIWQRVSNQLEGYESPREGERWALVRPADLGSRPSKEA